MKSFLSFATAWLVCLVPLFASGQAIENHSVPEVDVAEVIRRGSMVTSSGMGVRAADESAVIQATAPPADDNNRWHVTLFVSKNCQYCDIAKADFQKSPELLAFVAAREGSEPWAHFNVYSIDDETQEWRVKPYKISAVPVVVIQPPRDGSWGNPGTVILKKVGYNGDAKKLANEMSAAVKTYASVMSKKGYPKQVAHEKHNTIRGGAGAEVESASFVNEIGDSRTAPFAVPPPVDPFRPQTYPTVAPLPGGDFGPPLAPVALTIDQIQAAVPDAPPTFVLDQYKAKETDVSAVKLAWLVEKAKKPAEPPAPVAPPAPTPLTYEQVKEILPGADAATIDEIVTLHKPATKEQALSVADTLAKKKADAKPEGTQDGLGGIPSLVMNWIFGPQAATLILLFLAVMEVMKRIAPLTPTKVDDNALVLFEKIKAYLPGGAAAKVEQTKTTLVTNPSPSSTQ